MLPSETVCTGERRSQRLACMSGESHTAVKGRVCRRWPHAGKEFPKLQSGEWSVWKPRQPSEDRAVGALWGRVRVLVISLCCDKILTKAVWGMS